MKKLVVVAISLFICVGLRIYWASHSVQHSEHIVDFDYSRDGDQVKRIFNDNLYWMLGESLVLTYSFDWALKHRTSSQKEKLNDVVIKVWRENDEIIGFISYHRLSLLEWKILFLLIDEKYRRKGYATKLMSYALDDMIHSSLPAEKINLVTRVENPARKLYERFNFELRFEDGTCCYYRWKRNPLRTYLQGY